MFSLLLKDLISDVVWPTFFLMNVFIALKGSHFWFLLGISCTCMNDGRCLIRKTADEPRQANLCLRAFRHDKFQLRMPSHSEGPGVWLSVCRFLLPHCLYERAAEGSGETARMRRLAWTFAARIGDKYQIRLTRSRWLWMEETLKDKHKGWNPETTSKVYLFKVKS